MADLQLIIDVIGEEDMVKAVSTAEKFERQFKKLARAQNNGLISAQQYAKGVNQVERSIESAIQDHQRLGQVIQQSSVATAKAGTQYQRSARGVNRFGVLAQQSGYQVGDFIVQVQSGTNAFVAFGQQATQVAGTLTLLQGKWVLIGTALGITIPLVTAVGAAISRTRESAEEAGRSLTKMDEEIEKLKAQFKSFEPVLSAIGTAFYNIKEAAIDGINAILNNLARLVSYAATIAAFFAGKFVASFVAARVAAFSLSGAIVALGTAIKTTLIRTGIGILIVAVGEVILAFSQMVQIAGSVGDALSSVGTIIKEVFSSESISAVLGYFQQKFIATIASLVSSVTSRLMEMIINFSDGFNRIAGVAVGTVAGIKSVFESLPEIIGNAAKQGVNLAIDAFAAMAQGALIPINLMIRGVNALGGSLEELSVGDKIAGLKFEGVESTGGIVANAFSTGFEEGFRDDLISGPVLNQLAEIESAAAAMANTAEAAAERFAAQFGDSNPELVKVIENLRSLREEANKIDIREWFGGGGTPEEDGAGGGRSLEDSLTALQEKIQSVADTIRESMSEAFMSMVEGTKTFSQAIRDMARAVLKQLFDILVVQQLVGSFDAKTGTGSGIVGAIMGAFVNAKGNVFHNGAHVQAFANGGVVGSPTFFPMANGGVGLMGEAGPEAIMPLKRGKGGRLGVEVSGDQGNVTIHQTFAFSANGDDSVKKIIAQEAPKIAALTQKQMLDARRRGGVVRDTFA